MSRLSRPPPILDPTSDDERVQPPHDRPLQRSHCVQASAIPHLKDQLRRLIRTIQHRDAQEQEQEEIRLDHVRKNLERKKRRMEDSEESHYAKRQKRAEQWERVRRFVDCPACMDGVFENAGDLCSARSLLAKEKLRVTKEGEEKSYD